ncbi:MAG: monovalent cation/H+ antiporter subunit D family protein [Halobacteriota archaeon]
MVVIESISPLLAISCPFICVFLIMLFRKRPNIREGCTIFASIVQFLIIISMAPIIVAGNVIECQLFTIFTGLDFVFRVDAFGLIFAITSSFLWILVSSYSIGYMRTLREHAQTRYYACFALAIFGAVGIALSQNLITMYFFYEALTVSTYPLVAHNGLPEWGHKAEESEEAEEARFAGRKYLAYLFFSGWFFFVAIVLTFYLAGTTDFENGGILTLASASRLTLMMLFALFMLGSMKAAWMPLHSWLPTAMAAPTPVSALLHAVAVVKAGVFVVVRVVCYIYGIELMSALGLGIILVSIAAFTMIVASLMAIAQDNLKKRLAYSTISQLSYILFGVALLNTMGVQGAMLHIPFHGFMKITLFMCAGAIIAVTGKKNISEMAGIGRAMPVTMAAFTVGALGMSGIPPVCGFISKWYLGLGTLEAHSLGLLAVLMISSLLDIVYFFPIIYTAFFGKPEGWTKGAAEPKKAVIKEASIFMLIPLTLTAIFSIIFCLFPDTFYILELAQTAVAGLGGA